MQMYLIGNIELIIKILKKNFYKIKFKNNMRRCNDERKQGNFRIFRWD